MITNKHNLPSVFENFLKKNEYSRGESDISVTSLIDSPQVFRLKESNKDKIETDVADQIFSLLGTAVHSVLEASASDDCIVEERVFHEIKHPSGKSITMSGAVDLRERCPDCDDGWIVSDYKTCSVNTFKYSAEGKPQWDQQLNCYAYLLRESAGIKICGLQIVAICRDWSLQKSKMPGIPATPIVTLKVQVWSEDRVNKFISERINEHLSDDSICSPADRWMRPGKFAVMRKGRASAVKLFQTEEEVNEYLPKLRGGGYYVEYRESQNIRCMNNYCEVADYCKQWSDMKEALGDSNE